MYNPLKTSLPVTIKHQNPFLALQQELDKAMGDFYGLNIFEGAKLYPSIDIVDDTNHFKVEAEMPGLGEEDIKVSIDNNILTIKGEKSTSRKDKDKNYKMREITYGSYERQIALPDAVDIDKASASFKKGMLWIEIPKKQGAVQHARDIKIQRAE